MFGIGVYDILRVLDTQNGLTFAEIAEQLQVAETSVAFIAGSVWMVGMISVEFVEDKGTLYITYEGRVTLNSRRNE